uniref:Uncharacterized protein n=1 Tax=viral metagenome TaxID=1070528 RepID=A0A6C0ECB4_9ZZZZ
MLIDEEKFKKYAMMAYEKHLGSAIMLLCDYYKNKGN